MGTSYIGVYGMGVMGQSIALNIANHGYKTVVYNRSEAKTKSFLESIDNKNISGAYSLEEFLNSLESPRRILLMLTAGPVVDKAIDEIIPYLDKDDIIIDGGNTYFKDTIRREACLKEKGIGFIGAGVSGGEKGALEGPSIMPSGERKTYEAVEKLLMDISAKTPDGFPCCTYIGPDGSGHFVKTVHNGIEYADIQIICDIYQLMRDVGGMDAEEMQQVFEKWNEGRLNSYLIDITSKILKRKDEETGKSILDIVLDTAGQKGTGKWTSMEALDLGVPVPSIVESVFARYLSAMKEDRVKASKVFQQAERKPVLDKARFIEDLENALYAAKICVYAQGYQLLQEASNHYHWDLDLGEISLIWREGCIIRAAFLNDIKKIYSQEKNISNLMLSELFSKALKESYEGFRKTCIMAIENGIPVPGLMSTLSYFDAYRTENSSANLLQAQRDFFGAHTYERVDKEGFFHTVWE